MSGLYQPKVYRKDGGDTMVVAIGGAILDERNLASIYVDQDGSDTLGDGSLFSPFATLTKALTLVTATRKNIKIMSPGEYAEAAAFSWPNVTELSIIGADGNGGTVISGPTTGPVITINPTYGQGFEAFLENICIKHGVAPSTAQHGLLIDNEHMTTFKLLVHLKNVTFEQVSTGDSIHVDHTLTTQAIRIYANGDQAEIEGPVNITTINAADRFRLTGFMLSGGLVTNADDVASEITLKDCSWPAGAITGGHGNQKLNTIGCYTFDGTTYAAVDLSTTHANVNVKLT